MTNKRGFASDNNPGVHPEIMQAIIGANVGHAVGYGDGGYTDQAVEKFKAHLGDDIDVLLVFNGTGANIVGLQAMCQPFEAVLCAETAHINVDECSAPEKFIGGKLIPIKTENGKLTPELIKPYLIHFDIEHHAQPKVVSITQVTELGTLYQLDELKALRALADEYNLYIHLDGARISNAAAALNVSLKEVMQYADVVSFGGVKNGMMVGEAVVFMNKSLAKNAKFIRKQSAQLNSKMRFVAAQFSALLSNDLWLKNASHSNKMAKLLEKELKQIPEVNITQAVESNAVFACIPAHIIKPLQKEYFFYLWDESKNEARFMCSFDTTEDDVKTFAATLRSLL